MISTIISMIVGNVIPQLANVVKEMFNIKQDKLDKTQELEIMKLQIEAQKQQVDIQSKASFAESDAKIEVAFSNYMAELEKANVQRAKIKSGIKWVDSLQVIVTNGLGIIAGAVLLFAVKQAVELNIPMWEATALWEIVGTIIGYFVGYGTSAHSQRKVNK